MRFYKFNTFISTLNFILFFIGYQLATSLFLPLSSDVEGISRTVTVPYRAFALGVSLLVIALNFKVKLKYNSFGLYVLLLFWFFLILRMFYDIYYSSDVFIEDPHQLWMFVFGVCLPAVFSVMKSIESINLEKALNWIYGLTIFTILLTLFLNQNLLVSTVEFSGRQSGNVALNTIYLGHLGTMGILLSLFILKKRKLNSIKKLIVIIIIILATVTMLRAGSRSPIIALMFALLFWLFSTGKNVLSGFLILTIAISLMILLSDQIFTLIGNVSTVIEWRLRASFYEGDTSERMPLYEEAFQAFINNPLLGDRFSLKSITGEIIYSHNFILDAFMGLGFLGGIAILYISGSALNKSYILIKNNDANFWVSIILIQQMVLLFISGAFYYNQLFSALLSFVFIYKSRKNTNNSQVLK